MSNIKEVIINPNKPADVKFVQYDTGQKLYVKNSPDFDFTNTTEIQITDGTESAARYRFEPYGDGGIVELPDTMFRNAGILKGYIFSVDPNGHTTEALISIGIRERPVYNEYISDASEEVVIPAGFEVIQNPESVTIKAYNTDGTVTEGTVENGSDGAPGLPGERGSDGISPEASVEQTATGAIITVKDARGTTSATLENGHDGNDGISPTAKVEQTAGGAKVTITDRNGTTVANLTNGQPGQPGTRGQDGVSPSINIDTITGGHRLTITDESHGTQYVDVMDGERGRQGDQGERGLRGLPGADGVSPTAKVTQTPTGATVTVTDGDGTTTANLTNGRDGAPGVDGISPTATVEQTETGARVTITDKNGTTTANLTNGAPGLPGSQGLPGVDGYSPIATVTQTDDGAEISITDRNGTTEAVVRNGAQGEAGIDGVSPSIVISDIPGGHRLTIFDGHHGYQYVDVMDGSAGTDISNSPVYFTIAQAREALVSGEKLSVIIGKIQKYLTDLNIVAFTGSYTDLADKPSINGVTLVGNKTADDLGLGEIVELTQDEYDALTDIDPDTAYFINDADPEALGTAAFKDYTDRVRPGDTGLVMSHVVYSAINSALSSIYTPRGNIDCADLTSSLLVDANVGNVYETNDSGTTTALFVQGAGKTINAGDNVGIIRAGADTIMFNLMGNAFDLTDYQKKDLTAAAEGQTTVEGAIGALATNKQEKTLTTPVESRTTVEDALAALSTNKAAKSEMSVTDGTGADADKTTIQLKNGTSATVIKTHQDISGKADKVTGAITDDIAALDANGNITDSGYNKSDLSRGVGKYVKQGLASAGWYKIYECGAYNEGTAVRIDMGTFFNHQQNSAHVIDLAFGYQNAQMSEVCRDINDLFTKLRFCYNNNGKSAILVYYNGADINSAYAHIISAQHSDNAQAFAFVAVDASTYTSYIEYNLGRIGAYVNGSKVITESDLNKAITVTSSNNNIVVADARLITNNLVMVSGYIKNGTQLSFNTSQVNIGTLSVSGRTIRGTGPCSLFLYSLDLFGTNGPNTIPAVWKSAQGWLTIGEDIANNPTLSEDSWFTAMLPLH